MSDEIKKPVLTVCALAAARAICRVQHERGESLSVEEIAERIEGQFNAMRKEFISECEVNWKEPVFEHQCRAAFLAALERTFGKGITE